MGRLIDFFRPPVFDDRERSRRAYFYFWIQGTAIICVTLIRGIMAIFMPEEAIRFLAIILTNDVLGILGLFLVRRGKVELASGMLTFLFWSAVTVTSATGDGIWAGEVHFFVIVVFISGLTLGPRKALVTAAICALTELGLVFGELRGFIPSGPGSVFEKLALHWALLVVFASLQTLAIRTLNRSLSKSRKEIAKRIEAEKELRTHEEQLEATVKERTAALREEIAERQKVEEGLRKLTTAVDGSPISIFITDNEGVFEYVNPVFEKTTGYSLDDLRGKTPRVLKSGNHEIEVYQELWSTILEGQDWHGEIVNRTKDGRLIWEYSSISPVRGEDGEITHFVAAKKDITELKNVQDELTRQAHYDRLTGLPNRVLFFDHLKRISSAAKRHGRRYAIFFVDLDGFKAVNDTYGHDIGDALLIEVAKRFSGCVRESDIVARMGGDEFTFILTDLSDPHDPESVAQRVLDVIAQPVELKGCQCLVGACIGIALYPDHGEDQEDLLNLADAAMYDVKRSGKNNYSISKTKGSSSKPPAES